MNIMGKLNTLFRAGLRESAERVTDANAILIYRQEIADAENLLQRRRTALASLIATRKDLESEMDSMQRRLCERERQIAAIAPAQRSASKGRSGSTSSSARGMISAAPSALSPSASPIRPVQACTS